MSEFKREDRYVVVKRSDLDKIPSTDVKHRFLSALAEVNNHSVQVGQRQFVVIEADWPEYEQVWEMIQNRVEGKAATPSEDGREVPEVVGYRYCASAGYPSVKKWQCQNTENSNLVYLPYKPQGPWDCVEYVRRDEVARLNRNPIPVELLERVCLPRNEATGWAASADAINELRALLGKEG